MGGAQRAGEEAVWLWVGQGSRHHACGYGLVVWLVGCGQRPQFQSGCVSSLEQ